MVYRSVGIPYMVVVRGWLWFNVGFILVTIVTVIRFITVISVTIVVVITLKTVITGIIVVTVIFGTLKIDVTVVLIGL